VLVTEAICAFTGAAKNIAPSMAAQTTAVTRTASALGLR
jgi:hypothetical protein